MTKIEGGKYISNKDKITATSFSNFSIFNGLMALQHIAYE
jgi:hypothetical protein